MALLNAERRHQGVLEPKLVLVRISDRQRGSMVGIARGLLRPDHAPPSGPRQIAQRPIAEAPQPAASDPIIDRRAGDIVSPSHRPRSIARVQIQKRLGPPEYANLFGLASESLQALPINVS